MSKRKEKKEVIVRLNPLLKNAVRGPQVILPKDMGLIIAYTGVGRNSRVVEAGSGSGYATVMLANICKKVYSYETREEFLELARKNVQLNGLNNVVFRHMDITKGIRERNVDMVLLDLPDASEVIPHAYRALKPNGFVVGYLPNVEQMKDFFLRAKDAGFAEVFALEGIVREWKVRHYGVRPNNKGLVHTAFLVFCRKGGDRI